MPKLEQLKQDITGETREQLLERFRAIRADRKVSKATKKLKVAKKTSSKRKDNVAAIMAKMSPEELAALIKEMGEE